MDNLKRQSEQVKMMRSTTGWKMVESDINRIAQEIDSKWFMVDSEEREKLVQRRKAIDELFSIIDNLENPIINQ